MRSVHIVEALTTGASTAYDAEGTPFHAGSKVIAIFNSSMAGTAGGRAWTVEGNNEAPGATPVWVALTPEMGDQILDIHTITMPRQIRLNNTTAGSGSKSTSLHIIGGT